MSDIIATSPIINCGTGMAATRLVLRRYKGEYVVHKQRFYEDGSTAFDHGNYFPDREPLVILKAWDCFHERSRSLLCDGSLYNIQSDPVRFRTLLEQGMND